MKRILSVVITICLASLLANAQWKIDSFEKADPLVNFLQVLETESSTFIYATLDVNDPEKPHNPRLDRKSYVKVDGMKYKILNSVNIPLHDDADDRMAYLPAGKHHEVNFVMEFEKFPVKNGFDIICDPDEDGNFSFNGRNVQVSRIEEDQLLDTERFLDSGAPVIKGFYADNGQKFMYYLNEGVCVTAHVGFVSDGWFSEELLFYIDIVNNSDHGVMFDFGKVYAQALKNKKNGTVEKSAMTKYTPDSFDQFLKDLDYQDAKHATADVLDDVSSILYRAGNQAETGSWERAGWRALEAMNKQMIENRVNEYLKTHPTNRPTALRTQSIRPGDAVHGYIALKKKKCDKVELYIPMDGFEYLIPFIM